MREASFDDDQELFAFALELTSMLWSNNRTVEKDAEMGIAILYSQS